MCIVCGSGSAHLLRAIVRANAPRPAPRFSAHTVAPPVTPPLDPADRTELDGPAQVILRGEILTLDPALPHAQAIAIRGGRIQAVGDPDSVLAHRGRATRVVALDGRVLLPGFINAHWHMPFTLLCEWVDGPALPEHVPPGEWIVLGPGAGVAPDAIATHPAVAVDAAGAVRAGNALAGDLPAHVAGLVGRFPAVPDAIRPRLARLLRQTVALGVTTLRVCGIGTLTGAGDLDLLLSLADVAPLRLRATLDAGLWPDWQARHLAPGCGDDMVRTDTVSAWPDSLPTALSAAKAGWAVTTHAADAADLATALAAFAAAGHAPDARSGIESRAMPSPADLSAIARRGLSLGLTASEPQPTPWALPAQGPALSLGLDAAHGASDPLRMLAGAHPPARALHALTLGAAHRCGIGAVAGSLAVGKYADFAFLDRDPLADPAGARCVGAWVHGREVFSGG